MPPFPNSFIPLLRLRFFSEKSSNTSVIWPFFKPLKAEHQNMYLCGIGPSEKRVSWLG